MAGRKAFFTRDQVYAAAHALEKESEEPTVRNVHAYLGGGSFSSVLKYLNDWKANKTTEEVARSEMPPSVSTAFEAAWKAARAEASRELAIEKEKYAKQVDDAEHRAGEAISALEDLEVKSVELGEQLEKQTEKLQTTTVQLNEAISENNALLAVNAQLKAQTEKLERNLEQIQISHERLQQKHSEELGRLHKEYSDELSKANKQHSEEMSKLQSEMSELKQILQSQKLDIGLLERERNQARTEKETAVRASDDLRLQAAQTAGHIEALKQQNSDLLAKMTKGTGVTGATKVVIHIKNKDLLNSPLILAKQASQEIERSVIAKTGMTKIHVQEGPGAVSSVFEIETSDENLAQLKQTLTQDVRSEAEKHKCSAEIEFKPS